MLYFFSLPRGEKGPISLRFAAKWEVRAGRLRA